MAAAPDGGFHAAGGDRCRCTHVAVSVRLSSGAWHGCRGARRANARSTGMQERGQRGSVSVTVIEWREMCAVQHASFPRREMILRATHTECAAREKRWIE
ncbi:hypothetical protein DF048_16405 [Burkholderia seminalis]|nr:hypothetical protein DF048_16405 [Burkholderia seminalis]